MKDKQPELPFDMPDVDDVIIIKEWQIPHPNTKLLIIKVKRIVAPGFLMGDFVKVFTNGKVSIVGGNMDLRTVKSIEYSTDERFTMLAKLYKNDSISS